MEPHVEGGKECAFLAMEHASLVRARLRSWNDHLVLTRSIQSSTADPFQPQGPLRRGSPGLAWPGPTPCPLSPHPPQPPGCACWGQVRDSSADGRTKTGRTAQVGNRERSGEFEDTVEVRRVHSHCWRLGLHVLEGLWESEKQTHCLAPPPTHADPTSVQGSPPRQVCILSSGTCGCDLIWKNCHC